MTNKKKEKTEKVKKTKGKREALSLYPMQFDEALSALIKSPPQPKQRDKPKQKTKEK